MLAPSESLQDSNENTNRSQKTPEKKKQFSKEKEKQQHVQSLVRSRYERTCHVHIKQLTGRSFQESVRL